MPKTQLPASQIEDATITHADIAAANIDGVAATPSMRTLGTGAQQACAGNDSRLTGGSVPASIKVLTYERFY